MSAKTVAEQFEIDWERPINPWAENAAREAKNWTPEALCSVWACCGANDHREWWESRSSLERRNWMARYLTERGRADQLGCAMRSPGHVLAEEEESFQVSKALAERWECDLREAFLQGKPCPIKAAPAFQWILEWAFELARIPRECLPMQEESEAA